MNNHVCIIGTIHAFMGIICAPTTLLYAFCIPLDIGSFGYHMAALPQKLQTKMTGTKYLNIFKDHPYIFNLGHGVIPETDPMKVDYLVKLVKDY